MLTIGMMTKAEADAYAELGGDDWLRRKLAQAIRVSECTTWERAREVADRPEAGTAMQWVAECTARADADVRVSSADLYAAYRAWCAANQCGPQSHTLLSRRLQAAGYARLKSGRFWYCGIRLLADSGAL